MNIGELLGPWKLISSECKYSDGQVDYPLGKDPTGLLIYTANKCMSVQSMRSDRPPSASGDQIGSTSSDEVKAAGYLAYFGTYEVNLEQGVIIHHVKGSYFPNLVGQARKRFFNLSGNRLTLTTVPIQAGNRQMTIQLTWERIK